MKVAIPTEGKRGMEEQVSHHFGRAPTYTLIDTETGAVEVIENTSEHMGGTGLPPELLQARGAEAILCANLGHRAIELFDQKGISSYTGAQGTVRDALSSWREGRLTRASEETSCKDGRHHEHHAEHHLHKH
ncbi:MAG: NifB/NifX family molybdenum-iron cluster-binding protein [Candidatus Altiarchaeia archaeon]